MSTPGAERTTSGPVTEMYAIVQRLSSHQGALELGERRRYLRGPPIRNCPPYSLQVLLVGDEKIVHAHPSPDLLAIGPVLL